MDKKPFPYVTLTLVLINLLIYTGLQATGTLSQAGNEFGLKPAEVMEGRVYLLFTSSFLHGSLTHLLGNMLVLLVFGIILERKIGPLYFLIIYFLSDLIAGGVDIAARAGSSVPAIGASAAISGLGGVLLIKCHHERIPLGFALFMVLPEFAFLLIVGGILTGVFSEGVVTGLYLFLSIAVPGMVFLFLPLKKIVLWPLLLIWIGLQMCIVLWLTSTFFAPYGLWSHLSGFVGGVLIGMFSWWRESTKEQPPPAEIPAIG